jgi:hypothetical protein
MTSRGSFKNTEKFLKKMGQSKDPKHILERYGNIGVHALANATPKDSGETAKSWYYTIETTKKGYRLTWRNRKMAGNTPVAVLIQYGHGTGTGGYVEGRDFINPAMQKIFDQIAADIWKAVTAL